MSGIGIMTLRLLAIEVYKCVKKFNPEYMSDIFIIKESPHHWGWTHEGVDRHPRQDCRQLLCRRGKLRANLQTLRISWRPMFLELIVAGIRHIEAEVPSRGRLSFRRDCSLKSRVVTKVMHISVFSVSRVTVCHVEGDAMMDEDDAWLISQTVINISRFHFCYSCLFVPCSILSDFKTQ